MTNKIIEAAREAGFVVQRDEWVLQTMLRTFYAIARAEALEDAAKVCEQKAAKLEHIDPPGLCTNYFARGAESSSIRCANSIRALKEQQHG